MSQALNPLDTTSLLTALGAPGVFLALFAETGLLIGFSLPGDSLLFTAVLLCTTRSRHLPDGAHRAEELLAREALRVRRRMHTVTERPRQAAT